MDHFQTRGSALPQGQINIWKHGGSFVREVEAGRRMNDFEFVQRRLSA
jgi:hypothetical protein